MAILRLGAPRRGRAALLRRRTALHDAPKAIRFPSQRSPEAEERQRRRREQQWQGWIVGAAVAVDAVAIALPLAVIAVSNAFNSQNRQYSLGLVMVLPVLWLVVMNLSGAHERRILGLGSEEFKRVSDGAVRSAAVVATSSFALHLTLSRGILVIALPSAMALDLLGRYALRKWLHHRRSTGHFLHRVLVVGNVLAVTDLSRTLQRAPYAGMEVVGCCLDVETDTIPGQNNEIPVLGNLESIRTVVERQNITAVAVTSSLNRDQGWLRRLAWSLERTNVDVLVSPGLTDCVGPRIHIRPVAGLPLLHVEQPELSGAHRLMKAAFDLTMSVLALTLLIPAMLVIAASVRLSTPGPALFRQVRIGLDGRPFTLYKFRTMHVDAEARLADLLHLNERDDGSLFKMRLDPRVTSVGAFLRKYSLDELPQLINVLRRDMSLVGPRPPLPREVASYEADVLRRLMVPPGLTGLWQISGRSDLDWEESVRLDLFYVENWSLVLDLMILWKTLPAVLRHSGAY